METQFDDESIEQIPDINKKYFYSEKEQATGFTYLMKLILSTKKYPELIEKIKDYREQINICNSCGIDPLLLACLNINKYTTIQTIKELIRSGADINKVYSSGWNILMRILLRDLNDMSHAIVDELISAGLNVNYQDYQGRDALCIPYSYDYISEHHIKITQQLVSAGANINKKYKCEYENTILTLLCQETIANNNNESLIQIKTTIKELIKLGADVNSRNAHGCTALIYLCMSHNTMIDDIIEEITKTNTQLLLDKKDILKYLKTENKTIIKIIYQMYKYDTVLMLSILKKLTKEEQMNWYKFIVFKNMINENILKHRNYVYEKPNNIISMCAETVFLQKQNKYHISDKLKFLFVIKNETDCMNKINFYL